MAITQFSLNHLDWHGTEQNYRAAKERIFASSAPRPPGAAVL
ncbi:MAG: Mur ligase family protein, partial [Woeseiaceae bacterium]